MSFSGLPLNRDKKTLRSAMRLKLAELTTEERFHRSEQIAGHVATLFREPPACLLLFYPTIQEPALLEAIRASLPQTRLLLPRVDTDSLSIHHIDDWTTLVPNQWGIPEPSPDSTPHNEAPNAALIPGLAFTPDGCRLGRGGGFYDRLLPMMGKNCRKIGVCFDFQLVPSLPTEPHDMRVDQVVTDLRES
jgi:5-formyltetrahydrofolate cyclo-ligase